MKVEAAPVWVWRRAMSANSARWTLAGKTALVTGATRGIGSAIAEELAQLGASVFVCARSEGDLQTKLQQWKDAGLAIDGCVCDVSALPSCERLMARISQYFQAKLDILVLNAAVTGQLKPLLEVAAEDVSLTIRTNFESCVHLSRLAHPLLRASGAASIVLISSIAGSQTTLPCAAIYHCTKGALNQLTRNLAFEWAQDGIRVNAIALGFFAIGMIDNLTDETLKSVRERIPLRRLGEGHEIAAAVAFLCMPCSSFTTGSIFTIDGGMTCHHSWAPCPSPQTTSFPPA